MTNPEFFLRVYPNLSRAADIAAVGLRMKPKIRLTGVICIDPESSLYTPHQLDVLSSSFFHPVAPGRFADIYIELPPNLYFNDVRNALLRKDAESAERELPALSPIGVESFTDTHWSLLKTATEKLDLGLFEIESIIKVSGLIAALDGAEKTKLEHLAEAIQYQSLPKDLKKRLSGTPVNVEDIL